MRLYEFEHESGYAVGTALWGQSEKWKLLRCPNQNVTFQFTTISASEKKKKTKQKQAIEQKWDLYTK